MEPKPIEWWVSSIFRTNKGAGYIGYKKSIRPLYPQIKRYYQRKKAKAHVLVAKKAVANKLARVYYHMLKRQEVFDLTRAFG